MIKNRELRYRFSFILNKKLSIKKRLFNSLLAIVALTIILLTCILSMILSTSNIILKYRIATGFIILMSIVVSLLSALCIHKDAKTKNLLLKISFGVSYKEYIRGIAFVPKVIITIISLTYFITIGIQIGEWLNVFIYFIWLLGISIFMSSLFIFLFTFMGNIILIFLVSFILINMIVILFYKTSVPWKSLIDFLQGSLTQNILIIFINIIMMSIAIIFDEFLTPKLNFVNWFDDVPEIYNQQNWFLIIFGRA